MKLQAKIIKFFFEPVFLFVTILFHIPEKLVNL